MINFYRNGSYVILKVQSDLGTDHSRFRFCFDCGNHEYAELLKDHVNLFVSQKIREIRQEEYENGWNDKAAKTVAKATWFKGWF